MPGSRSCTRRQTSSPFSPVQVNVGAPASSWSTMVRPHTALTLPTGTAASRRRAAPAPRPGRWVRPRPASPVGTVELEGEAGEEGGVESAQVELQARVAVVHPLSGRDPAGLPRTAWSARAVRLRGKILPHGGSGSAMVVSSPGDGGRVAAARACRRRGREVVGVGDRELDVGTQAELQPAADVVTTGTPPAAHLVVAPAAARVPGPARPAGRRPVDVAAGEVGRSRLVVRAGLHRAHREAGVVDQPVAGEQVTVTASVPLRQLMPTWCSASWDRSTVYPQSQTIVLPGSRVHPLTGLRDASFRPSSPATVAVHPT